MPHPIFLVAMRFFQDISCPSARFGFLLLVSFSLPGCGPASHTLVKPALASAASGSIAEPATDEVVIVINNNSASGTHAGIFAGSRLNDPSGSYVGKRMEEKGWLGPSLSDYVEFQKEDGEKIQLYRFRLPADKFKLLDERMAAAEPTPPLFCAAEVKNLIGGIGPFSVVEREGWISPAGLAELLDKLTHDRIGTCEMPDTSSC